MTIDKRYKNLIKSILIFITLASLLIFIPWDSDFAGLGILLLSEIVGIFVGVVLFSLSTLKILQNKESLVYNYFGMFNLIVGVILLIIGVLNMNFALPIMMTINILLGILIIWDIFSPLKSNNK